MSSGIYEVHNKINDKKYVGSAKNFKTRWYVHLCDLRHNKSHSIYLQRAWNKYGEGAFEFNILFYCDVENLILFEQRALDILNPFKEFGYNISPTAGSSLGIKHSKKFGRIVSKRMVGNKYALGYKFTEEQRYRQRRHLRGRNNKLKPLHIFLIREFYKKRWITQKRMAEILGVHKMTISRIITRKNWSWL